MIRDDLLFTFVGRLLRQCHSAAIAAYQNVYLDTFVYHADSNAIAALSLNSVDCSKSSALPYMCTGAKVVCHTLHVYGCKICRPSAACGASGGILPVWRY